MQIKKKKATSKILVKDYERNLFGRLRHVENGNFAQYFNSFKINTLFFTRPVIIAISHLSFLPEILNHADKKNECKSPT